MVQLPNIKVEIGRAATMFTASPTWTDISPYLRQVPMVYRGRSSWDGRFGTAVASLILDDRTGRFRPGNTSGAYYPDITIGMPVRITHTVNAVTYPIMYGQARSWDPTYAKGNSDSFVTLTLADAFYTLNLEDLHDESYPVQSTNARITAVLDDILWPASLRDLDSGVASVQATSFAAPEDGGDHPALPYLLDVAESEVGVLFMSRDGKVTFRNRVAQSGASPSLTLTSADISRLGEQYNDDYVWNVFRVAREDGVQIKLDNSAGAPKRVFTRDVMPMSNDAEVLNVAEWLSNIFGSQKQRVSPLTLKPLKDESGVFLQSILDLELRDFIRVQHTPPGGDAIDVSCAVEAITHSLIPGDWTVTLHLVPLGTFETQAYWILGTSQLGVSTRVA